MRLKGDPTTKQFMNLLNEAKAGNISISGEKGATGGPITPPCISTNTDPASFQIVNVFKYFTTSSSKVETFRDSLG